MSGDSVLMLLAMHGLALTIIAGVFIWLFVAHRQMRSARQAIRPPETYSFQSAFGARPALWLAVRAQEPKAVQTALRLEQPAPCSWTEGMKGERNFFIGPPVNGWIIVTGSGLPNPSCDVDECYQFLTRLSCQFSQVQFFQADRVLHHHAWARLENGAVIRAYAWAGETVWNQGAKTAAETELSMKCFGYGENPNADSWALVEWTAANVGKVPLLATRWSLDPARINDRVRNYADGIAGESSRV